MEYSTSVDHNTNLLKCSSFPLSSSYSSCFCLWAVETLHWEVYRSAASAQAGRVEGETGRGSSQVGSSCLPLYGSGVVAAAAAFFHWHFCCYSCRPSSGQ